MLVSWALKPVAWPCPHSVCWDPLPRASPSSKVLSGGGGDPQHQVLHQVLLWVTQVPRGTMGIIILTAQTGGSRFGAAVGAVHPFHAFHSPGHPWNAP